MLEPSELSEFLLAVYRAASTQPLEGFQDAALETLKTRLPFDSCTWGVGNVSEAGLAVHSAHFYREVPNRYLTYDEVKREDTVAFEAFARPAQTLNYHLPTLYAAPHKAGMREYVKRVRHQNELVMVMPAPVRQPVKWLALYRADPGEPFSERQRALCDIAIPHLMQALEMNRALHVRSLAAEEGPRRFYVAIADLSGYLHEMEPPCAELLRREWPNARLTQAPAALAAALARPEVPGYQGSTFVTQFRRLGDLVVLKMRERLPIDALTARERQIARHIAAGRSHKEIARSLGIAPATVRNHIQRIHERLQAHTNAEVAAQFEAAGRIFPG